MKLRDFTKAYSGVYNCGGGGGKLLQHPEPQKKMGVWGFSDSGDPS